MAPNEEQYLTLLQTELSELKEQLQKLGVRNPDTPSDWIASPSETSDAEPDPNDLGDRSEDWQENRGTLSALETRFNNLKRALVKINNGGYGSCEICNEVIEEDRLVANPAARTCKVHLEEESSLSK